MRTVLINIAVFLGLCVAAYTAIPVVSLVGMAVSQLFPASDRNATLPNYAGTSWARRHFEELHELQTEYASFLGWRRQPFAGRTITIEAPLNIRRTPSAGPANTGPSVYFFGGSAIWGVGADDAQTIPALYQKLAGGRVMNFGESGWNAHQSLNQLMKLYTEGHRPDVGVFYDGFNDVRLKCRAGSDFWADEREARVRQAVAYRPLDAGYFWQPIAQAAAQFRGATTARNSDCDTDPQKARLITEQLLADWQIAAALVASHGGRFRAYLQPVAFYSQTRKDQLRLSPEMQRQFDAIYQPVRERIAKLDYAVDLTKVLDADEYFYLDAVHVSPNGNALVARRIAEDLK